MRVDSTALADGHEIELRYAEPAAGGQNRVPDVAWSGLPDGTLSVAVTCWDPDARRPGGWWHWLLVDVAPAAAIPDGGPLPDGSRTLTNTYGYAAWGGPCPPHGTRHRYVTTVWALDVATRPVADDADAAAAETVLNRHALDSAALVPLFTSTL